jgi:hypothetical protein
MKFFVADSGIPEPSNGDIAATNAGLANAATHEALRRGERTGGCAKKSLKCFASRVVLSAEPSSFRGQDASGRCARL